MGARNAASRMALSVCTSLALVAGCGSDDPEEKASAESTEELTVLDCTDVDVDNGPPPEETGGQDLYYLDTIKASLAKYEVLRERYGDDEVKDCEQAHRYWEAYKEVEEQLSEQYLEEYPLVSTDDAVDISEIDTTGEPGPPEEQPEASTEDAASTGDAAVDIQKVHNGTAYGGNFIYYIEVENPADKRDQEVCSATAINSKWLMSAAHCFWGKSGAFQVWVSVTQGVGLEPALLFRGAVQMEVHTTDWDAQWDRGDDLALAKLTIADTFKTYARIWLGDIPWNQFQWTFGFGRTLYTQPPDYPAILRYGRNKIFSNYWNQYGLTPFDANNNGTCAGDSGGPSGVWHDGVFAIHGVHSVVMCGEFRDSTGKLSWNSYNQRPRYHSGWIAQTVGTCSTITVSDGSVMQCW